MRALFVLLISFSAYAKPLSDAEERAWEKKFVVSCTSRFDKVKSTTGKYAKVNSVKACGCVARNQLLLARSETEIQVARDQLNWVERFYRDPKGLTADPFALESFMLDFDRGCMADTGYVHPRLK